MLGLSQRAFSNAVLCLRQYSTVVDKTLLSKLRKKTGYPMLNCKKALEQFNNEIKEAETWMKEQAQKEGWSKATKLQGRPMSAGLVGVIEDRNSATLLEVNCETDFVAKNEKFQALVATLAQSCHKQFRQVGQSKVFMDKSNLNMLTDGNGKTLADNVAVLVGNLGENMAIRRAAFLQAADPAEISSYVHSSEGRMEVDGCKMGKFGTIVKLQPVEKSYPPCSEEAQSDLPSGEDLDDEDEFSNLSIETVGEQMCQHVTGMNPLKIGEPVKPEAEEGGKKKKKKKKKRDDETNLLSQEFLLASKKITVQQYLEENSVEVLDFIRLECGEELEQDESM